MRFRRTQKQLRNPLFVGSQQYPWVVRHPRWIIAFIIIGLAGCLYLVYGLPTWQLTKLKVNGQYTLPLAELRQVTKAQQQGRWLLFFRQKNLWAFDTRAYERRLRERWMFSKLEIHRSIPDTITLTLTEEQPSFIYQLNDKLLGIDRNGIASTFLPVAPTGIPQLTLLAPLELKLGDVAISASQAAFLNTFISSLRSRNDEKLIATKATIAVAPDTTIRLMMVGDWEIIVNAAGSADEQVQALILAYEQKLKGRKIEYVDVSVPARVYVK